MCLLPGLERLTSWAQLGLWTRVPTHGLFPRLRLPYSMAMPGQLDFFLPELRAPEVRVAENKAEVPGASLVAQWQRICLPMQETRVWSLAQEDLTCLGVIKSTCRGDWSPLPRACAPLLARRSLSFAMKRCPCSMQLGKSPCSHEAPAQTKINKQECMAFYVLTSEVTHQYFHWLCWLKQRETTQIQGRDTDFTSPWMECHRLKTIISFGIVILVSMSSLGWQLESGLANSNQWLPQPGKGVKLARNQRP